MRTIASRRAANARKRAVTRMSHLRDALGSARERVTRLIREDGSVAEVRAAVARRDELAAELAKLEEVYKPGSGTGRHWVRL